MTPETIGQVLAVVAALGGLWKWMQTKLDADRKRLDELEATRDVRISELEKERDRRLDELETKLGKHEEEKHELFKALTKAETMLEITRQDLKRAIAALNAERGRACRYCGKGGTVIATLDEITEEVL